MLLLSSAVFLAPPQMLAVWDFGFELTQATGETYGRPRREVYKVLSMANKTGSGSKDFFDVVVMLFKNRYCLYINMYANTYWHLCVCVPACLNIQFNSDFWQTLAF